MKLLKTGVFAKRSLMFCKIHLITCLTVNVNYLTESQ